ncbi:MAG: hypothetical protein PXX73_04285 [Sideroxydans sp.]|nr:hypothetical protein [Sideroxydans sp.]
MKKPPPLRFDALTSYQAIAAATGCSQATAKRWHALGDAMPPMALRLVNFYTRRDLSAIFGRDWHEFGIYQGRLVCDMFRSVITPKELRRLMFLAREVPSMRDLIRSQKNALAALSVECANMRRDNAFFRDQFRQENALRQWQGTGFC